MPREKDQPRPDRVWFVWFVFDWKNKRSEAGGMGLVGVIAVALVAALLLARSQNRQPRPENRAAVPAAVKGQ